jgi:hypothetical protein
MGEAGILRQISGTICPVFIDFCRLLNAYFVINQYCESIKFGRFDGGQVGAVTLQ